MKYFIHSILTNMFRVIPVLFQDYKVTNVVLSCRHYITIKNYYNFSYKYIDNSNTV
jgi:hypothetical protein